MDQQIVEKIEQMRAQKLSDYQITQQLQRDGHTQNQIYQGFQMTDTRQNAMGQMPPPMTPPQNGMQMQPQSVVGGYGQMPPPGMPPGQPPQNNQDGDENFEELIEAVIEEKWGELKKSVEKITDWKDKTEAKIATMQQRVEDIRHEFDKLHQAVVGKIGDYDKNILEVGTQLEAMEKVFSKVLPTFTQNVNELDRITQNLKK